MRFMFGGLIILHCFFYATTLCSMEEMDAKARETLPFYETVVGRLERITKPFETEEDVSKWASAIARFKAEPIWLSSIQIDPLYNKMLRCCYRKIIDAFFEERTTERLQQAFDFFDLVKLFELELKIYGRMPGTYLVPSLSRWTGKFESFFATYYQEDLRMLGFYIYWKQWLSGRGCAAREFSKVEVREADGSFVYLEEIGVSRRMTLLDFYIQKSCEIERRLLKASREGEV